MAITMTDRAKDKIQMFLNQRQTPSDYLRVGLRGGGCSGFMYDYEFISAPVANDKIFHFEDVKICIDVKSYLFLNGVDGDRLRRGSSEVWAGV